MKNNTKIRLHLSKQLFESLTKQVIAEAKSNMSGGAYTEAVKTPKAAKTPKAPKTEKKVEEMETKVAEAPMKKEEGQIREFAEPIQQLLSDPEIQQAFGMSVLKLVAGGTALAAAVKQGMKMLAKKAIKDDPEAFKGKSVDQVAAEMGSAMTGKVQKTAGGSGEGGFLGK